jgi:hypothetical protein
MERTPKEELLRSENPLVRAIMAGEQDDEIMWRILRALGGKRTNNVPRSRAWDPRFHDPYDKWIG